MSQSQLKQKQPVLHKFAHSWVGFIRTMCKKYNITVNFGRPPSTNGKEVNLPNLPMSLMGDDAMIVRGDAYHEFGHCRFTNFPFFTAYAKKNGKFGQSLLNAIEDPWMEKRACSLARMAQHCLRESSRIILEQGKAALGRDSNGEAHADPSITAFVLCYYFSVLLGWNEYDRALTETEANLLDSLGGDVVKCNETIKLITDILDQYALVSTSTKDNGAIADLILAGLERPLSEEEFEDVVKGENLSDGEVVDFNEAVEAISKDPAYAGQVRIPDSTITNEDAEDSTGGKAGDGATLGISECFTDQDAYLQLQSLVGRTVRIMSAQLARLLMEEEDSCAVIGSSGSRLAGSKLGRIPLNNPNFFKRFESEMSETAAVSVLCDLSYSTKGPISEDIQKSVFLISSALEQASLTYEVLGFGSCLDTLLVSIKPFASSLRKCSGKIGGMQKAVGGGTPLLEASHEAAMRLAGQENKRKYLFVLTDGGPCDPQKTQKYLEYLMSMGVTPIVVCIGRKAPTDWLKDGLVPFVKISSSDELPEKFISLLAGYIT